MKTSETHGHSLGGAIFARLKDRDLAPASSSRSTRTARVGATSGSRCVFTATMGTSTQRFPPLPSGKRSEQVHHMPFGLLARVALTVGSLVGFVTLAIPAGRADDRAPDTG